MTKAIEELFRLTSLETGITATDLATASLWTEAFRYQVPVDKTLIFQPGHTFSAYLENNAGSPAELAATDKVKIELKDADETMSILLLQPTIYARVKEFQDRDLVCRLDISEEKRALPGFWIAISVYTATSLDASDCRWELTCNIKRFSIAY